MPVKCPVEKRFHNKYRVNTETGCWEWTAYKTKDGYGRVSVNRSMVAAHRVSYILAGGTIPPGLQLDHLCRNRSCVNPEHLEAVDARTNTLRGDTVPRKWLDRTHCKAGHPLTDDNIHRYGPQKQWRECLICFGENWRKKNKKAWIKHKSNKEAKNGAKT